MVGAAGFEPATPRLCVTRDSRLRLTVDSIGGPNEVYAVSIEEDDRVPFLKRLHPESGAVLAEYHPNMEDHDELYDVALAPGFFLFAIASSVAVSTHAFRNEILAFHPTTLELQHAFGRDIFGDFNEEHRATSLAVAGEELFVSDFQDGRASLHVFSFNGEHLRRIQNPLWGEVVSMGFYCDRLFVGTSSIIYGGKCSITVLGPADTALQTWYLPDHCYFNDEDKFMCACGNSLFVKVLEGGEEGTTVGVRKLLKLKGI